MIDLDREMRALLDDEARRTPPLPGAASTLRRTRRRQALVLLASFVVVVAVAVGSVAGASALIRSTESGIPADEHLTPAPLACPAGSTPDRPGPVDQARPGKGAYSHASMAFDSASHRMMMLTSEQTLWAFDVCTNTWARETGPGGPTLARLVYDVGSGRMLAIQRDSTLNVLRAWAYDAAARTWTPRAAVEGGIAFAKETPQAVYDPTIAAVIVRDWATQRMWTYEVEANAWTELDTGPTLPPYVGGSHPQLLTYDDTVDRLVLYVGSETAGHE